MSEILDGLKKHGNLFLIASIDAVERVREFVDAHDFSPGVLVIDDYLYTLVTVLIDDATYVAIRPKRTDAHKFAPAMPKQSGKSLQDFVDAWQLALQARGIPLKTTAQYELERIKNDEGV